jgi:hypothetical protein
MSSSIATICPLRTAVMPDQPVRALTVAAFC